MSNSVPTKLSKDLANAVYDDWKRKVIDDAKKRAVSQNVDYDTFKNMVSVAHLQPIQAASATRQDRMLPSWQFNADGSLPEAHQMSDAAAVALKLMQQEPQDPPTTSGDFYREWRRNCPNPDSKYRYLRLCGPGGITSLFKVEISSEALKEIIEVLEACWLGYAGAAEEGQAGSALKEAGFVVQVLQSLSTAGRFSLTVKLIGSAAKKVLDSLLTQLEAAVMASETQKEQLESGTAVISDSSSRQQGESVDPLMGAELSCNTSAVSRLRLVYGVAAKS
ncbi:hypothetical protein CEUSTIGMA_g8441.t1 [Chlamydomonas eustigma]|uniref:Uncharacterized protein n=1 Tax=Chlamydomonas eustigma TaxID=1157962 RepID=A0A250XD70_9CHLO|nr:hypothetical protein CEUSTIGMA_g8441.t1 [Chlamydomonas eustigma]|eukprot:GAX81006.1 hypothetical protein CEUSTIGMA_g8441.t1 [Chlamydomonas eustigma]